MGLGFLGLEAVPARASGRALTRHIPNRCPAVWGKMPFVLHPAEKPLTLQSHAVSPIFPLRWTRVCCWWEQHKHSSAICSGLLPARSHLNVSLQRGGEALGMLAEESSRLPAPVLLFQLRALGFPTCLLLLPQHLHGSGNGHFVSADLHSLLAVPLGNISTGSAANGGALPRRGKEAEKWNRALFEQLS